MSENGKGSKVAGDFRTPQWEKSKLWDNMKSKYQQEPVEDVKYLAAIEYEYLCESFDRRQPGALNKRGEFIPYNLGPCSSYSSSQISKICKKYDIKFSDFKYLLNPEISFERVTEEYKRLIEAKQPQVNWHQDDVAEIGQINVKAGQSFAGEIKMKPIATLKGCTGDPDEVYILEFEQAESKLTFNGDPEKNYEEYMKNHHAHDRQKVEEKKR